MSDLVEFLRARLDEDERIIKGLDEVGDWSSLFGRDGGFGARDDDDAFSAAGDRFAADRLLAEVEAKRRIIGLEPPNSEFPDFDGGCRSTWEDVLWELAQPYAGHPDFNPGWKP
jgi:hypothetical protein